MGLSSLLLLIEIPKAYSCFFSTNNNYCVLVMCCNNNPVLPSGHTVCQWDHDQIPHSYLMTDSEHCNKIIERPPCWLESSLTAQHAGSITQAPAAVLPYLK